MRLPNKHLWCSANGMDLKCKGHGIDSRLRYQSKMNHAFQRVNTPRTAKSVGLNFLVSAWQGSVKTPCGADWQLFTAVLERFPLNTGPKARRQLLDSFLTAP